MPEILDKKRLPALIPFAMSNVLLVFDFDGTLAPIVVSPDRAKMRVKTRRLLAAVARRYPCVVISGRAREDLARRLDGVPVTLLAGNHGLEPWGQEESYMKQVRHWARKLNARFASFPGIVIEDKGYSLAIHYRQARNKRRARKAIMSALRKLPGARVMGGEQAVNVIVQGAPNKGSALELARRAFCCDTAIYAGDDDTDEDAFEVAQRGGLLSIRVGLTGRSRARYRLRSQRQIDELLEMLLACRPTQQERPSGTVRNTPVTAASRTIRKPHRTSTAIRRVLVH